MDKDLLKKANTKSEPPKKRKEGEGRMKHIREKIEQMASRMKGNEDVFDIRSKKNFKKLK